MREAIACVKCWWENVGDREPVTESEKGDDPRDQGSGGNCVQRTGRQGGGDTFSMPEGWMRRLGTLLW